MGSSPADRRQHERYNLEIACQISFTDDKTFPSLTRNISIGGAKVILKDLPFELSKGTPCQLKIQTGGLEDIHINAIVMRHRENSIALFFKILDNAAEETLARFLAAQSKSPA
jgi:c-di-GMP-binding flagellar brake protein YcgR